MFRSILSKASFSSILPTVRTQMAVTPSLEALTPTSEAPSSPDESSQTILLVSPIGDIVDTVVKLSEDESIKLMLMPLFDDFPSDDECEKIKMLKSHVDSLKNLFSEQVFLKSKQNEIINACSDDQVDSFIVCIPSPCSKTMLEALEKIMFIVDGFKSMNKILILPMYKELQNDAISCTFEHVRYNPLDMNAETIANALRLTIKGINDEDPKCNLNLYIKTEEEDEEEAKEVHDNNATLEDSGLSGYDTDDSEVIERNSLIGNKISKIFNGIAFEGIITSRDSKYFQVQYNDGDSEDLSISEVQEGLDNYRQLQESLVHNLSIRKYFDEKSIVEPSTTFVSQLGRCREKAGVFSWYDYDKPYEEDLSNVLHFDPGLGRVYLKTFRLHGEDFQIGDFFKEVSTSDTDNYYYRILGAFQALKSFVGKWYSDRTCIQKRGHVYLLVVPLVTGTERHELFLHKKASEQYESVPVDRLPIPVADLSPVQKINVEINATKASRITRLSYYCNQYRTKVKSSQNDHLLTASDVNILKSDVTMLWKQSIIPNFWDVRFDAKQAITIRKRKGFDRINSSYIDETYEIHDNVNSDSDDSDGFDEESEQILAAAVKRPKQKNRLKQSKPSNGLKTKRKKSSTSKQQKRKIARISNLGEWQMNDSINETGFETVEVVRKLKCDTLLKVVFGSRIREQNINQPETLKTSFVDPVDRSKYEIVSYKEVDKSKEEKRFCFSKEYRVNYVQVSGPGIETIDLQERLDEIADFSSLPPGKLAARLELLQSPAATLKNGQFAIFDIKDADIGEIEEHGHTGCGFICEQFLDELINGKTLNTLVSIQVRIYAPSFGLFKGVLMRKKILTGAKIQLPSSMKKVGPSKSMNKRQPVLLVNNAGMDPSKTAAMVKQLHFVDPNGTNLSQLSKKDKPKIVTDMIEWLWLGLGIPYSLVQRYIKDSSKWSGVNHMYLRGVADPTNKIPPDYVYITGLKSKETRDFLDKNQLFITRIPVVKVEHSLMVKVMTEKPATMSESEYEWLETLPFGAIIFGFPSENMLPMSEVLDGDMDGDRFFVCCNKEIVLSLKDMPRYVEVEAPPEPAESSKKKQNISNMNWLSQVQKSMTSSDTMEIKQLAGALYNAFKKIATNDKEKGISNPDAIIFGSAYVTALDHAKHGGQILVPKRLHHHIKTKKFHRLLTDTEN